MGIAGVPDPKRVELYGQALEMDEAACDVTWAEAVSLATQHAWEARRLMATFTEKLIRETGGYMSTPVPISFAQAHAAISQAWSAVAAEIRAPVE